MNAVRTLAQSCNFCSCLHDSLVRDRLVLGIRNSGTRKKLLQEKKLTLSRAIDICKSSEATSQQMKTMAEKPEEVLAFDSASKGKFNKSPFKDARGPRLANVDIVVVNTNEAAPRALLTGKLVAENQIISQAFAHKGKIEVSRELSQRRRQYISYRARRQATPVNQSRRFR